MRHRSSSFIKSSSQDNTGEGSERKRRHCISGIFFFLLVGTYHFAIKLLHRTTGYSGRRGNHRSGAAESGVPGWSWRVNWPVPGMWKVGAGRMGKLLEILTITLKSQFKS